MVARQKEDGPGPATAGAEFVERGSPPLLTWRRRVEEITGAEDGIDAATLGEIENPPDDLAASTRELPLLVFCEHSKPMAEVPVGCVEEL